MKTQNECHPPMTALEAHMEEEIAREAKQRTDTQRRSQQFGENPTGLSEELTDQAVEEAMLLGR